MNKFWYPTRILKEWTEFEVPTFIFRKLKVLRNANNFQIHEQFFKKYYIFEKQELFLKIMLTFWKQEYFSKLQHNILKTQTYFEIHEQNLETWIFFETCEQFTKLGHVVKLRNNENVHIFCNLQIIFENENIFWKVVKILNKRFRKIC